MKKLLYSFVLIGCIWCKPACAWLPLADANAWMGGDSVTSLIGTVASLIASFSEPEMGATVIVTQEEADALGAGSEKYVKAEMSGSATSQGFSTTAYDYVRQNIFEGGASMVINDSNDDSDDTEILKFTGAKRSAWPYLNNRIDNLMTVDDTAKFVKETFFVEDNDQLTQAKIDKAKRNRTQYLQAIGSEYSLLAQEVQRRLIPDLESVNTAPFNGDGLIGAVTGMDQTWLAATRALMADIALQLQLLEVDAAMFLQLQPIEIIPAPANLKTSDDDNSSSETPENPTGGENA
ncbi:MAG: hypothetical protein J6Y85_00635 [Alphaproteobacteria bacterium]|nr:hypothetical protein [Alphaproteobacteria bacterium]